MKVRDPELLARMISDKGISLREMSIVAGWRSHTYLQRLIRGQATTLKPQPAARIARHLGVPIDLLFVTRLSTDTAHITKRRRAA